ncbi:MAG: response regulator transcription factor [Anaerolineae bacterium]|nr:response regulator transcription factor [Anaerolineae bacterium]
MDGDRLKAKILLIEGKSAERPSFNFGLTRKGFLVDSVHSGAAALAHLKEESPHIVLLDSASMRSNGRRICSSVRKTAPDIPLIVVIEPEDEDPARIDADVILMLPFTLQKLLNRIRPLLPNDSKHLMHAGPFSLDVDQRMARCGKRQVKLTPRLVTLLKMLMEHSGEVIDRNELFKFVWDTGYLGDTRTLDVHISWLRQFLEEDPRRPRYIKTVRGVGYRLDIS